jgi:TPR repeat protein
MKQSTAIAICLALALCACSNKDNPMPSQADMSAVRAKLAFACVHEADHLPPLDPQADTLFKYALFLEKQDGPKDFNAAARYYRVAAAHGHYKANHNLQLLVSTGQATSPDAPNETIDLVKQLIAAGIPGGYYDMGHYLELGYGVKQDEKKARVYFRKAADLGSPEAQAYIGKLLEPNDRAPEVARQMRQCATEQGNRDAANELGIDLTTDKLYTDALNAFQKGVASGDPTSAWFLRFGFDTNPSDAMSYIGQPKDHERSRRYGLIWKFLNDNDGLNPKVLDIDQIVPLPPAKLPPWDGTFQWQKEQEAAKPPQKPSEQLVERLAREKHLDPATGLPLAPAKSAKEDRVPLGVVARTGQMCPQDGIWTVQQFAPVCLDATRHFRKGETMPQLVMNDPRPIPGLDAVLGMRVHRTDAEWSLQAYSDLA